MIDDNMVKLFVEKYQLHINCLLDPDRLTRTKGLDYLSKNLFRKNEKDDIVLIRALLEKLISPLLKCFEDKIEKNRQMAIEIIIKFVDNYELEEKIISLIINSTINRLNFTPFPETSEELRQSLITLLHKILKKYQNDLLPVVSDLCAMIAKLLTDACPEVKIKLSEFISDLSSKLSKVIGPHTKAIVVSLCSNLKHAHNKIRKISLIALSDVLLCETAGKFFDETIFFLKMASNDKNYDVRKTFYSAMHKLITNFNIVHLRKYEHYIVIFLLNGLSDEKNDIQLACAQYIEDAGEYRMKLAIELGEDIENFNNILNNGNEDYSKMFVDTEINNK